MMPFFRNYIPTDISCYRSNDLPGQNLSEILYVMWNNISYAVDVFCSCLILSFCHLIVPFLTISSLQPNIYLFTSFAGIPRPP